MNTVDTLAGEAPGEASTPPAGDASASTQRSRALRRRRKLGLRVAPVEVSADQVAALVRDGLIAADRQNDMAAIAAALGVLVTRALDAPTADGWLTAGMPDANGRLRVYLDVPQAGRRCLVSSGLLRPEHVDSYDAVGAAVLTAAEHHLATVLARPASGAESSDGPPIVPPFAIKLPEFSGMSAGMGGPGGKRLSPMEGNASYRPMNYIPGANRQIKS